MTNRLTAWRDVTEWNSVKDKLFGQEPYTINDRREALTRIQAWSVRGRLPHAVSSTMLLVSAVLQDEAGRLGSSDLRLLMSMAISRFVNGLIDPAQQAINAISMSALARTINLPETFVEIRHSATHDSLPSLAVLRLATSRALEWLWHNYWSCSREVGPDQPLSEDDEKRMKAALRAWRKSRQHELHNTSKTTEMPESLRQAGTILKTIQTLEITPVHCIGIVDYLTTGKSVTNDLNHYFDLWHPFLYGFCKQRPLIRNQLVGAIIHKICTSDFATQDATDLLQMSKSPEFVILTLLLAKDMPGLLEVRDIVADLVVINTPIADRLLEVLQSLPSFEPISFPRKTGRSLHSPILSSATNGSSIGKIASEAVEATRAQKFVRRRGPAVLIGSVTRAID